MSMFGMWNFVKSWSGHWECSECSRVVMFKENFCPTCGAKMA